jgi:hypothetical protein
MLPSPARTNVRREQYNYNYNYNYNNNNISHIISAA